MKQLIITIAIHDDREPESVFLDLSMLLDECEEDWAREVEMFYGEPGKLIHGSDPKFDMARDILLALDAPTDDERG